jgi:hypothetical protein
VRALVTSAADEAYGDVVLAADRLVVGGIKRISFGVAR